MIVKIKIQLVHISRSIEIEKVTVRKKINSLNLLNITRTVQLGLLLLLNVPLIVKFS